MLRNFNFSASNLPVDQNGYEYLPPERVGFGEPLPPRPIKTTNAYATATALQLQSFQLQPQFTPATQISQLQPHPLTSNSQRFFSHRVQDIYASPSGYVR